MLVWVTIYWCCWCCWCWWKAMTTGWRYRLGNSLITTFHSLHFLINSKTNFFVVCLSNCFVKALKKGKQNELGRADLCKSFDWNILFENKSHVCPGFFTCFQLFCELWSKCSKGKAFALAALGLRNAYILKNRVIKHQFLPEIRNQEKQHQIPFPSPSRPLDKSELGIFSEGEI